MQISVETTADGSPTLYRQDIDEHYHSVKGAVAESIHVYLRAGWLQSKSASEKVRVFEVGFGTGLNAAITAEASLADKRATEYYSVELYPLPLQTIEAMLPGWPNRYKQLLQEVNSAGWNQDVVINPFFMLHKMESNLLSMKLPENIDVVYFDAFAPEKQPEMWSPDVFRRIFDTMNHGGILTTYCAKGCIRRLLQDTGFVVERLPGPPGGKREILRATKP